MSCKTYILMWIPTFFGLQIQREITKKYYLESTDDLNRLYY